MAQPKLFLVLSSGFCGSYWLAASLDKHPGISCSCAAFVGMKVPHDSFEFGKYDPGVIDAFVREQGITTIDDLFDRLKARKPANAAGDVHAYRGSVYKGAIGRAPHQPAALAHLVRHPVVLLERIALEQIHRYTSFPRIQELMTKAFPGVCGALEPILAGIDWQIGADLRGLGFLFAILELQRVFTDLEVVPEIKLWAFENLISDRDTFARLVHELTGGAVRASDEYLDDIFDRGNLETSGRYRRTSVNSASSPDQVFAHWAEQEREAFRRLMHARDIPTLYRSVGYDFAFVD